MLRWWGGSPRTARRRARRRPNRPPAGPVGPAGIAAILAAAALCRCAGDGIEDPTSAGPSCASSRGPFRASFTCIQRIVLTPTCAVAGCHDAAGAQQGLDLSEGAARAGLVGVPSAESPPLARVTPGEPGLSYLIWKLEGDPNIVGERMPRGGPYLSQAEIDVVRRWILEGAKDD